MSGFRRATGVLKLCRQWLISGFRVVPAWIAAPVIAVLLHLAVAAWGAITLRVFGSVCAGFLAFVITTTSVTNRRRRLEKAERERRRREETPLPRFNFDPAAPPSPGRASRQFLPRRLSARCANNSAANRYRTAPRLSASPRPSASPGPRFRPGL